MELIWPFGEPRGLRFGLTFATFSLILFVFYPISSLLMEFDVPSKSNQQDGRLQREVWLMFKSIRNIMQMLYIFFSNNRLIFVLPIMIQ